MQSSFFLSKIYFIHIIFLHMISIFFHPLYTVIKRNITFTQSYIAKYKKCFASLKNSLKVKASVLYLLRKWIPRDNYTDYFHFEHLLMLVVWDYYPLLLYPKSEKYPSEGSSNSFSHKCKSEVKKKYHTDFDTQKVSQNKFQVIWTTVTHVVSINIQHL